MPHRLDRRISPRWVAIKNQATLEFLDEAGSRRVKARMVNISRHGALLVTEETTTLDERFWLRMETPAKTDWIGAVSVRFDQLHHIGIRFSRPCPDDFLLVAMMGIDLGSMILEGGRPLSFDDTCVGV
jgi:hypothetical protein